MRSPSRVYPWAGAIALGACPIAPGTCAIALGACAIALGAGAVGCGQDTSIAVLVVTPDGGDPFLPPDAATQARLTVEDGNPVPVTVPVSANGSFRLDVILGHPAVSSRLVLQALRGGSVVGWGATPPLAWNTLGAVLLPVFVQRTDSLARSPWSLSVARVTPALVQLPGGQHFAAALGGATDPAAVDVFDLLALTNVAGGASLDGMFNRDASVIPLGNGAMLVIRGCAAVVWTPSNNTFTMPTAMPSSDRCDVLASTVVAEPTGGGLLLGGHNLAGPVTRVDRVAADGTFTPGTPLSVARDAPSAVRVGSYQALVAGGQTGTTGFLERWTQDLPAPMRAIATNDRVDGRTGAVLVDAGGGIALALGGTVAGSTALTTDDVVLDTGCLMGGCTVLVATLPLVGQRRTGAVAVRAEGGSVLVVGGTTVPGMATAVADQVEVLDVTLPRMPVPGGSIGSLPYGGLSLLPLETGAVMIAGGNRREVWLYRH